MSGFADIQSEPLSQRPQMIRTIVADKTTAIFTAQAISAALFARERTKEGQHIKISMLDTMIAYLWPEGMMQYTVVAEKASAPSPTARPDLIFQTKDGYITCGTISDSEWNGFCKAVEMPALAEDKRFNSPGGRAANAVERITLMADILKERTSAAWLERLDACDVPCAPVLRRGDVVDNEQVVASKLIQVFDQPTVGDVRQPRPAAQFDRTPAEIQGPAPRVGEHTAEILAELGYGPGEIERLAKDQVIKTGKS